MSSIVTEIGPLPPLITVKEAARIISASERWVRGACAKGEVEAVKIGTDWRVNSKALLEQFGIAD